MDFDNRKVYGDTSITDGLVLFIVAGSVIVLFIVDGGVVVLKA